jgi:hydrogenase maturation factor HypF (carbamoyltransferase family)
LPRAPTSATTEALAAWAEALDRLVALERAIADRDRERVATITADAVRAIRRAGGTAPDPADRSDAARALFLVLREVHALMDRLHPWISEGPGAS